MGGLEIKHICGYRELKGKTPTHHKPVIVHGFDAYHDTVLCEFTEMITIDDDDKGEIESDLIWINIDHFKPLLHPLSDLTKPIVHKGVELVPIDFLQLSCDEIDWTGIDVNLWDALEEYTSTGAWSLRSMEKTINYLYELHFDIHNLIPSGLALDINQVEK